MWSSTISSVTNTSENDLTNIQFALVSGHCLAGLTVEQSNFYRNVT